MTQTKQKRWRSAKPCTIEGCRNFQDSHTYCANHAMRYRKYGDPLAPHRDNKGERNGQWKGDKVSYEALHEWVRRWLPEPPDCQDCHEVKRLDLANISQKYKRDLTDWEYICRKCHMQKDGRAKRLRFTGRHTDEVKDRLRNLINQRQRDAKGRLVKLQRQKME